MASSENGTDEPLCKGEIETQKWRTDVWSQEGNRGHIMRWIGRQGLTPLRIKQITKENFLYSTGKSTQFLCGDLNAKKKQKRRDLCIRIVQFSHSVMSDSLQPHGLQPTRLLRPWDFPDKSTGVGCHRLYPLHITSFFKASVYSLAKERIQLDNLCNPLRFHDY